MDIKMINQWKNKVLLLEDDFPGYNFEESKFIRK